MFRTIKKSVKAVSKNISQSVSDSFARCDCGERLDKVKVDDLPPNHRDSYRSAQKAGFKIDYVLVCQSCGKMTGSYR